MVTHQHNNIVTTTKNAAAGNWSILLENQRKGFNNLRPDVVLKKNDEVLILDVTCPSENRAETFDEVRRVKEKYNPLIEELRRKYKSARADAIVVGSLVSWNPRNEKILGRICSKRYLDLMKRLIVSDTIRLSRNLYIEVLTGVRQVDTPYQRKENRTSAARANYPNTSSVPSSTHVT